MAKNILIVLDHEKRIPPFMLSIIRYAEDKYDNYYYVNTNYPINKKETLTYHVSICYPNKWNHFTSILSFPFFLLSYKCLRQVGQFIKLRGLQKAYFLTLIRWGVANNRLYPIANKIINTHKKDNIVVLSTWFGACSYTAAKIKEKYPHICTTSLAHSYEVLVSRDNNIPYYFVDYRHKNLDGIFFISKIVRDLYIQNIGPLKKDYLAKMFVNYLGSFKTGNWHNERKKESFHIVTCSRMIPLKRLDILILSLKKWSHCNIKWTHLGDGPLYNHILQESQKAMKENGLLNINILGRLPNEAVKTFYKNESIDIFINLSSIEGLPISIMEAISYGIPVIATDVGGTSEIVNSETGFLLPANINPTDVLDALETYYKMPEKEINSLRNTCQNFWEREFNADKNIINLFNKLDNIKNNI